MIDEAKRYIEGRTALRPAIGVVLGSGLGAFADELTERIDIPYADIPGWPRSTAVGHAGKLVIGKLGGAGRGGDGGPRAPVRRLRAAAGDVRRARAAVARRALDGVHQCRGRHQSGAGTRRPGADLAITSICRARIRWWGRTTMRSGPRFPDMSEAYSRAVSRNRASRWRRSCASRSTEGVYAAMLGPSYETPAEIRFLRTIGADVVGMSTVPEVIVANHMGMKVLGISCVTNMAAGILPQKINHEEVLETGAMVRDTLVRFLKALLPRLAGGVRNCPTSARSSARRWQSRANAFAPFSNFRVGAAIEDADGRIHTGCNVENATYGLTLCAERVAVFKAISEGVRKFRRVAVAADTDILTPPCGACRQILWEFCGDVEIVLVNLHGKTETYRLKDLFPKPFDVSFL